MRDHNRRIEFNHILFVLAILLLLVFVTLLCCECQGYNNKHSGVIMGRGEGRGTRRNNKADAEVDDDSERHYDYGVLNQYKNNHLMYQNDMMHSRSLIESDIGNSWNKSKNNHRTNNTNAFINDTQSYPSKLLKNGGNVVIDYDSMSKNLSNLKI